MPRRRALAVAVWVAIAAAAVPAAGAQQQGRAGGDPAQRIRQQQDELARVRREREELERQANRLRTSVHDLAEEVNNLDRRAAATARIVSMLEEQLATLAAEVDAATANLGAAERELADKRAALHRRATDIYKRGPMHTTEALLSARSFGELVARYKYLHLLAVRDRALVQRVEQLRDQIQLERNRVLRLHSETERNRAETRREEERLRALERQRAASLAQARQRARQTENRLNALRRTETQLTNAIAALEAERRRLEAARPPAARSASTIRTTDYGSLDWPVDGPLLYTFGRARTATNATIRWNGVGIEAPAGTPVRAVAAGNVVSVRQLGTYGLTVIVDHGGGDYSIYGSLQRADVREQQAVAKGEVIGGVGIADPDLPPHLHFEIRHQGGPAVDPATWLRRRR